MVILPIIARRIFLPPLLMLVVLAALGPQPDGAAAAAPAAQSPCTQQVSTVEELVQTRRMAAMGGAEDVELPTAEIIAMLRTCWAEYQGQMPAAEKNCALFKQLVREVLGWSRQVSLLGLDGEFAAEQAEVMPWATRGLVNCFNEAFDKCVDQHDPTQLREMVAVERQLALLGSEDQVDRDKYEKCARFEVDFESQLSGSTSGDPTWRYEVRATIPLTLARYTGMLLTEPATLRFSTAEWGSPGTCGGTGPIEAQGTASVTALDLDWDVPAGASPLRALTIELRERNEILQIATSRCMGPVTAAPFWGGFFYFIHSGEVTTGSPTGCGAATVTYTFRSWTRGSGAVLAEAMLSRSGNCTDTSINGTTTIRLRHAPRR